MTRLAGDALHVGDRHASSDRVDALAGHHHRGRGTSPEVERARQQRMLEVFDEPFVPRRLEHGAQLGRGVRGDELVGHLHAEQMQQRVRQAVEHPHDRREETHDGAMHGRQREQDALGEGQRKVAGHHLGQHEVAEGDGEETDPESDRVHRALGWIADVFDDGFEKIGNRRLRDVAQRQRRDGDAELRGTHAPW